MNSAYRAATVTMAADLCEYLNLEVERITAASIRQQQNRVISLNFAAPNMRIPYPTPSTQ